MLSLGQHSDHHRHRFDSYSSRGSRRQKRLKEVAGKKEPREVVSQERLYHWHNEPDTADIPIDLSYVRNVVEYEMARYSTTMMRKFLRERNLGVVRDWIIHNQSNVKVGTLKRFCKVFGIDPNNLEKGVILNPSFPLDMSSRAFIKVKSHVLNEGRIEFGYKSVYSLDYHNQDPVLLWYFANAVREAGGNIIGKPHLEVRELVISADRVLARALVASGLPFGRKTLRNPSLDPIIEKDPKLLKYHIQATLPEEGWFSLKINHGRAYFDIAWGRSVDITDKLTEGQIESLREISKSIRKRKIPIGSIIDPDLDRNIRQRPPNIFRKELDLLSLTHEGKLSCGGYPTKVHLSKSGRITAFWEIHFTDPKQIDLIHDEYGMPSGTWKAKRFENLYEAYKKYRGRRLTKEEIQEIRKIKEENPPDISVEWISEKMKELFPDVEWGGDLERIRKMLGRKEKG